jgi:hypothetical protein
MPHLEKLGCSRSGKGAVTPSRAACRPGLPPDSCDIQFIWRGFETILKSRTNRLRIDADDIAMISKPLSQIIEIPDASLNEKLVAANDNAEPTALSREHLEAESILAPREDITPRRSPLVNAVALCLLGLFALGLWYQLG